MLSDQATPNRLSTAGNPSATTGTPVRQNPAARPTPVMPTAPAGRSRPTPSSGPSSQPSDQPRQRVRIPSVSTLLFIFFLVAGAARWFNGLDSGGSGDATRAPRATSAPRTPVPSGAYGAVTFGTSMGDDCALDATARSFSAGAEVWWRADLLQVQASTAAIVVVTKKDGKQIDYEYVPPDPSVGRWQVFCSGPAMDDLGGSYAIELWNPDRSRLLAKGEFTRLGPPATGAPTTSSTALPGGSAGPAPTFVVALAGKVTFGTALDGTCTLAGLAEKFEQTEIVWWRAELNQAVPVSASVRLQVMLNGRIITDEPVPEAALIEARSIVCAWAPTTGAATGAYVVQVWTSDRQIMLANGTFFRNP